MNPLKCVSNYCGLYHAKEDQCPCCMNKLTAGTGNSSRASVLFGSKHAKLQPCRIYSLGAWGTKLLASPCKERKTQNKLCMHDPCCLPCLSWMFVKTELLKILQAHPSIQNIVLKLIYCKCLKENVLKLSDYIIVI